MRPSLAIWIWVLSGQCGAGVSGFRPCSRMNLALRLCKVCFLAALLSLFSPRTFGAETAFEVEGYGETRGRALDGGGRNWAFSVSVRGCSWAIKLKDLGYADGQAHSELPDYYLAAYDGKYYYCLESFEGITKEESTHNAAALRASDPDPVLKMRELKVLWYLYASHCFFSGSATNMLPPIDALPWDEYCKGDYFRPGFSRLSQNPPYLPLIARRGHNFWGTEPQGTSQATGLRKGELLSVSTVTNLLGLEIPLKGQLECQLSIAAVNPWIQMAIETRELRQLRPGVSFVPELLPRTMVSDAMLWKSNPPFRGPILITNEWPSVKESQALYRRYMAAATPQAGSSRKTPSWTPVVWGALGLCPVLILVLWQARTGKAKGKFGP